MKREILAIFGRRAFVRPAVPIAVELDRVAEGFFSFRGSFDIAEILRATVVLGLVRTPFKK